jgi:enoyl-CoA hydratase
MSLEVMTRGPVAFVTLNRADRANAYTQAMLTALETAIQAFDAETSVRVVVITGQGSRSFSAGADRREIETRSPESVVQLRAGEVFQRLRGSRCVTIAAVNGAAVGGGFELALACDLRIAADHAAFWLPEPELGLLPAAGGLRWLPEVVGQGGACELILGGARWSAAQALARGLVSEVVPSEDLDACVARWTERVLQRDRLALELAKRHLAAHPSAGSIRTDGIAQAILVSRNRSADNERREAP